jgi:hypothetical protein
MAAKKAPAKKAPAKKYSDPRATSKREPSVNNPARQMSGKQIFNDTYTWWEVPANTNAKGFVVGRGKKKKKK